MNNKSCETKYKKKEKTNKHAKTKTIKSKHGKNFKSIRHQINFVKLLHLNVTFGGSLKI